LIVSAKAVVMPFATHGPPQATLSRSTSAPTLSRSGRGWRAARLRIRQRRVGDPQLLWSHDRQSAFRPRRVSRPLWRCDRRADGCVERDA